MDVWFLCSWQALDKEKKEAEKGSEISDTRKDRRTSCLASGMKKRRELARLHWHFVVWKEDSFGQEEEGPLKKGK